MFAGVVVKTRPVALPLDADQLRLRLNVDRGGDALRDAAEDDLLLGFCAAGVSDIDGPDGVGFAMLRQTWTLTRDDFAPVICLPGAPVVSVSEVRFLDADFEWQVVDPARYRLALGVEPVRLVPIGDGWPSVASGPGVVAIDYLLGVPDVADLDQSLITAVAMLAGHYFENREAVVVGAISNELPLGPRRILERYMRGRVG